MSKETALAFYKAIGSDEGLITKIKDTNGDQNALLAVAKELGYDFTWQDWVDVTNEIMNDNPADEVKLTDEELEAVAGGVGTTETAINCPTALCYTFYCPTFNYSECFPNDPPPGGDPLPPPG